MGLKSRGAKLRHVLREIRVPPISSAPSGLDELVLAAGAYSHKWAKTLGTDVPMNAEHGGQSTGRQAG